MFTRTERIIYLAAFFAASGLAGCSKGSGGTSDSAAGTVTTSGTDTAMAPPGGVAANTAAGTTLGSAAGMTPPNGAILSDANIAAMVDQANAADSAAGSLAASKGTRADVKEFGRLMMHDHHMMRKQGDSLAMALNLAPQMPAGSMQVPNDQAVYDSLNSMPRGAAWDRAYVADAVAGHQHVLAMVDSSIAAAQNPALKALLQKARPKVQEHLNKAQALQNVLATVASHPKR